MARWRLLNAHYLVVPGTEWEYKETDRNTGKQARKVFQVPAFLDPKDPADQNYPGDIIVCHEGTGHPKDIVFVGEPTPDMEPLDDEAQALTDSLKEKWVHPIESLSGVGYSQSILNDLERKIDQVIASQGKPVAQPTIDPAAFAAMQAELAELKARLVERRL
jgi:hypothetical protein